MFCTWSKKPYLVLTAFLLLFAIQSIGQTFPISLGGTQVSCSGIITDSDAAGGNYAPNENYTITICSDGYGNVINVNFATGVMDLGPGDTLFVYDGNSASAPLITYFVMGSTAVQISTTTANSTGCVTFVFTSDGTTEATGFQGDISCSVVCQPIDPQITSTPVLTSYAPDSNYINACPGDSIILNASGAYPHSGLSSNHYTQSDASSTFEWNLGDGTLITGQNAGHVYANEQGYFVTLTVTDVNGCVELFEFKVRHAPTPNFNGIYPNPDTICFGDSTTLVGGFLSTNSQAFGASQDSAFVNAGGVLTGQTYLPDGSGAQYTTDINIAGFGGQTINAGSDIQALCVTIEHSYLGDLEMMLTCPNGTSVAIFDSYGPGGMLPNGFNGGNDFLGQAFDGNIGTPGIGWEYCFFDAAPNPPWALGYPTVPVTTPSAGNSIPSDDYQPEDPFTNLIGCPIDGNWTLTVQDNLGIDDGYIFEWEIIFDPSINPNSESYYVGLTDGYWETHADIYSTTDSTALAAPANGGDNPYVFFVEDEYGCVHDTTVNVYMLSEILPFAGNDTSICPGSVLQLNGATGGTAPPSSCDYTINMYDSFGDGWNGSQLTVLVNGVATPGSPYTIVTGSTNTVTFTVNNGDNIDLQYSPGVFENEVTYELLDPSGAIVFNDGPNPATGNVWSGIAQCNTTGGYGYSWSPATDLSDPTIPDPTYNGTTGGTYEFTVWYTAFPSCSETDTIEITMDSIPVPELLGDFEICFGDTAELTVLNAESVLWSNGDTSSTIYIVPGQDSIISVDVISTCATITLGDTIVVNSLPNVDAGVDTTISVESSVVLNATGGAQYVWSPPTGLDCVNCPDPTASPLQTTVYYVTVMDTNGCIAADYMTVYVEYLPLFLPTAFSPNGDGVNDVLYLRGKGITSMNFQVFDRWGNQVFQSLDRDTGWDGTFKGNPVNSGVYVYYCKVTRGNGEVLELKGNVTLTR